MLACNRNSISNGRMFSNREVDGRTKIAKRFADLVTSFGPPKDESDRALIRSACHLICESERLQALSANAETVDLASLARISGICAAILKEIGNAREIP
jgi:hypothetical protein